MRTTENRRLMETIDKGVRAGVKQALSDHKKAGIPIVVWENGRVKKIPDRGITVNDQSRA